MNVKSCRRGLAMIVCGGLLAGSLVSAAGTDREPSPAAPRQTGAQPSGTGYFQYFNQYAGEPRPQSVIEVAAGDLVASEDGEKAVAAGQGRTGCLLGEINSFCVWSFEVAEAGMYSIYFDYLPLEGTRKDIEFSFSLDGGLPFGEAGAFTLSRLWEDAFGASGQSDITGNDLRPIQTEKRAWLSASVFDIRGMYDEPYLFRLEAGVHTVRIDIKRESMLLAGFRWMNEEAPSYADYRAKFDDGDIAAGKTVRQEAENAFEKSNQMLFPTYDRSTPATRPNDPYKIRLNTIGQNNWNEVGETITWKADVPGDGLYKIEFRARQNFIQGKGSYRSLLINGKIPFAEAKSIEFPYRSDWYIKTVGDGEPYDVYLKKGDLISLRCEAGKLSGAFGNINQAVLDLNEIYRRIIVITGVTPDIYRDYNVEKQIPGLLESFTQISGRLRKASAEIIAVTEKAGSQTAALNQMADMLDDFAEAPHTIPERLPKYKSNIESMGSLLLSFGQQPLELDCLAFVPEEGESLRADAGFLERLSFGVKKFLASFFVDYEAVGSAGKGKNAVSAWVNTGRDQAQILSNMIENVFSAETGIPVALSIVDTGDTLIKAALAGKAPDVSFMVGHDIPVNLAMRGALTDLSDPAYGIDESFKSGFFASTWVPFFYNGGLYALPETQGFNLMFYRTDIFEELGLAPPNTWEEFYKVAERLQGNNLQPGILEVNEANAGVSAGIDIFNAFLFQNGGGYYNEALDRTEFDTGEAFRAFEKWAELYTKLGLDREFNFFNRFRTGEMPLGISSMGTYNQLMAAAPEIKGLWKMVPIPGTPRAGGGLDRSESGGGSACIMLSSAKGRKVDIEASKLMKWWAGAAAQTQYGYELEATLGVASRYYPASVEAFKNIGWTAEEYGSIYEQWKNIKNIPQIPGNYLVSRSLTNALRSAIDNQAAPRRILTVFNKEINEEISRKRREFRLD